MFRYIISFGLSVKEKKIWYCVCLNSSSFAKESKVTFLFFIFFQFLHRRHNSSLSGYPTITQRSSLQIKTWEEKKTREPALLCARKGHLQMLTLRRNLSQHQKVNTKALRNTLASWLTHPDLHPRKKWRRLGLKGWNMHTDSIRCRRINHISTHYIQSKKHKMMTKKTATTTTIC